MSKISNWFYGTTVGGWYFELLLWLDRKQTRANLKQLTPGEISTVVQQKSLIADGVSAIGRKVNKIKNLNTEDLVPLAAYDTTSSRFQVVETLKSRMDLSNVDIKNDTDKAKMIDKRIQDMNDLQAYTIRRNLVKDIRAARRAGEHARLKELEQEFKQKYGR